MRVSTPRPGAVRCDPEELWSSVVEAGRRALAAAGRPVDVIALANQGETVLRWDPATGRALSECVVWQDGTPPRSATGCAGTVRG